MILISFGVVVLNLSAWEFMSAHIKICIRYTQSHSFVCYSSVEFKKGRGPGTLNQSGPYFNVWYLFQW